MKNINLWYKMKKTLQNEGMEVLAYKSRRYIKEQIERRYYLNFSPVPDALLPDYYYFGHPKCATNWIRSFLYHLCLRRGINYKVIGGDSSRAFASCRFSSTFNLHVNSLPDDFKQLDVDIKGFRVVRDPRDLLVSAYFSWKNSHYHSLEKQMKLREMLRNCSMEEGLDYLMKDFDSFKTMGGWDMSAHSGVLMVRYEDLLSDEYTEFKRIVDHLGIDVDDDLLALCVKKSSFKAMAGKRKKGQENKSSHYRKGVAGDWVNYLPRGSELHARFMEIHGSLMSELGL